MDDLISRQEAIEAVENAFDRETILNRFVRKIAISAIRLLPSAQPEERALHESCTDCPLYDTDRHSCPRFNKVIPETLREVQQEQRWIPVTERLPENSDTVLITHRGGVSVGWYNGRYWERGASTNHRALTTVVAWMPLPTPWEGRQE